MAGFSGKWTGQSQPMAAKPQPNDRHGVKTMPDNAWSTPPAGTGQGAPFAAPTDPSMSARGIRRDLAWTYGHSGTARTRPAFTPHIGLSGSHARNAAQASSAAAHSDIASGRIAAHTYAPQPQGTMGETHSMDIGDGHPGPTTLVRSIVHGHTGGSFSDGAGGEVGPVGFRLGEARRWVLAPYKSPAIGAMYSKNSLRGILPQTISTPHNQPGLPGVTDSGIPSNARFLARPFTMPRIFKTPTPESQVWASQQQPDTGYSPVVGVGMI